VLLDKGFFSVEVISYLKRAGHGFIIPAMVRGRKAKGRKKATGLRAIQKKKNGYYRHTSQDQDRWQRASHTSDHLRGEQKTHAKENRSATH